MAIVTKKFRDDFETWAAHRIATGEWSESEMADFKDILRLDLSPGPDQLRIGVTVLLATGVTIPAVIDNQEERYRLWANFFADEAECIRQSAGTTR